ncbi:hypothetical protein DMC30DRAFT_399470 [Rhodotorula diobovata]|uniref:Uncharacterized protein n=1 Tax=Rhodotorula diobovata TaxID=5288 RepID=A0A5C5FVQ2_9BASI|nr:hypothetical protein DMC30DRAFT_399470 [Rhodotorula diobovata]
MLAYKLVAILLFQQSPAQTQTGAPLPSRPSPSPSPPRLDSLSAAHRALHSLDERLRLLRRQVVEQPLVAVFEGRLERMRDERLLWVGRQALDVRDGDAVDGDIGVGFALPEVEP